MAFLANNELSELLKSNVLPNSFNIDRLKNASYELTLGPEVYTNGDSTKTILDNANVQFELKPGQFAILITEEKLEMPTDYIGFISLKFGFKFKGLVNISGFHVDPGFKGKLKFSVYNAGSDSIILEKDAPYFVLWISELTSKLNDGEEYNGSHQGQTNITPEDIMKIKGETASPNQLLNEISRLDSKINQVGTEVKAKKDRLWWLGSFILGVILSLGIKHLVNKNQYQNGYNKALKDITLNQSEEIKINSSIQKSVTLHLDSLANDTNFINKIKSMNK